MRIILIIGFFALFGGIKAQVPLQWNNSDFDLAIFHKWQRFYDPGVYDLQNPSNASAKGFGLAGRYPINGIFVPEFTYSIALSRNLAHYRLAQYRYYYQQFDLNLQINLFKPQEKYLAYLYLGYGIDKWESSAFNLLENKAVHNNFGLGLEYRIGNKLLVYYQLDFALQHNENYQHNFNNQLGIRIKPFRQSIMKEMEEEIRVQYYAQDTNCVELLELRTELAQQNDSLARINDSMYLHAMQRMVSANAQLLMDKNELVSMLENRERVLDSLAHNKGLMSTDSFTRDSLSVGCTGYFVAGNNDSGCAVFKNGSNKSITIKFVSDDLATAIILLYILREESPGLKLIRL